MKAIIQRYGVIAFLLLAVGTAAQAQYHNDLQFNVNYNVNIPSGSFRNFINNPAWKGFTAGLAYPVTSQLRVGLSVGYNDYYQKYPRQVYSEGAGSDVSAVLSNSVQQIPLLATADYTLLKKGLIRPYVGAGAGVDFVSFDQYLGEFDNPQSSAHLALRGEAGILIPLSSYSATAIRIGGSYNYAPYNRDGIKALDNWGIHAGVSIPIR
ncbi:MAG: outer membrane beta-barrel protein [Bacteroidetes bacterium]|nr:outer membrane beta-barrel protein [Bacteroidota bacterium]